MARKVRWGILSTADIGLVKVIPAMQKGDETEVVAICSRDEARAREAAARLGIPRAYGSYEELLDDGDVEVVYNPLPNHLHVPWTLKCIEAGKHVLCEKPVALTAADVRKLIRARDATGLRVGEAFMVKSHPQWLRTLELVRGGEIGELRAVQGFFSYFRTDPGNIRNIAEYGGGGVWDIGCYPVTTSRLVFGQEPSLVFALLEYDPEMRIDRLSSVVMSFPAGQAAFTVSTQLVPYQRMQFFGNRKRIELEIPFTIPPEREGRIFVDPAGPIEDAVVTERIDACDQYTLQADAFSRAVRGEGPVPGTLEDALRNVAALEAIYRSGKSGRPEAPAA